MLVFLEDSSGLYPMEAAYVDSTHHPTDEFYTN